MVVIYLVQCSPLVPESVLRVFTGAGTPLESFLALAYSALS